MLSPVLLTVSRSYVMVLAIDLKSSDAAFGLRLRVMAVIRTMPVDSSGVLAGVLVPAQSPYRRMTAPMCQWRLPMTMTGLPLLRRFLPLGPFRVSLTARQRLRSSRRPTGPYPWPLQGRIIPLIGEMSTSLVTLSRPRPLRLVMADSVRRT